MENTVEVKTNRIHVLKTPVDVVNEDDLKRVIDSLATDGHLHHIVLITLWDLMKAQWSREYRGYLEKASLVLPVSRGIVRGAAFLKKEKPFRYLPFDFVIRILAILEERYRSVYLLGGKRNDLLISERKLRQTYPGLRIVGRYEGYYRKQMEKDIILAIRKASPNLLLIGNGVPGKKKWIRKNRSRLASGLMLWSGDCYQIFAERKRRISRSLFQKGLEYLPALIRKPWRVFRSIVYLQYLFLLLVYRIRKK